MENGELERIKEIFNVIFNRAGTGWCFVPTLRNNCFAISINQCHASELKELSKNHFDIVSIVSAGSPNSFNMTLKKTMIPVNDFSK